MLVVSVHEPSFTTSWPYFLYIFVYFCWSLLVNYAYVCWSLRFLVTYEPSTSTSQDLVRDLLTSIVSPRRFVSRAQSSVAQLLRGPSEQEASERKVGSFQRPARGESTVCLVSRESLGMVRLRLRTNSWDSFPLVNYMLVYGKLLLTIWINSSCLIR